MSLFSRSTNVIVKSILREAMWYMEYKSTTRTLNHSVPLLLLSVST